jgi:hypothetical protein
VNHRAENDFLEHLRNSQFYGGGPPDPPPPLPPLPIMIYLTIKQAHALHRAQSEPQGAGSDFLEHLRNSNFSGGGPPDLPLHPLSIIIYFTIKHTHMLYKEPKVNHRGAGNGFSEHLRNAIFFRGNRILSLFALKIEKKVVIMAVAIVCNLGYVYISSLVLF